MVRVGLRGLCACVGADGDGRFWDGGCGKDKRRGRNRRLTKWTTGLEVGGRTSTPIARFEATEPTTLMEGTEHRLSCEPTVQHVLVGRRAVVKFGGLPILGLDDENDSPLRGADARSFTAAFSAYRTRRRHVLAAGHCRHDE